jgi:hypothetical protein
MDGATDVHAQMLRRIIKFDLDTKDRGIVFTPDSEVEYKHSRRVILPEIGTTDAPTGYLVYLFEVAIAWKSMQQGGVTLSSREAEYCAISEVATELKASKMIMNFLKIDLPGPIIWAR